MGNFFSKISGPLAPTHHCYAVFARGVSQELLFLSSMAFWKVIFFAVGAVLFDEISASSPKGYFTAAVFEHARLGNSSDEPIKVLEMNLNLYWKAATIAKSKGADMIVFPEYGIFQPDERDYLKKFAENIPDPKKDHINPCMDWEEFSNRPILISLSCMAKTRSLFVVANTADVQNCLGDPQCPPDGVYIHNTNVVFNEEGEFILKYHKEHLFFELGMDLPKKQQDPVFETKFGKFATYTSFDIIYKRMGDVAKWPIVDAVAFTTMWVDAAPQLVSVQFFQSWAMGNNATLLAAGIQIPGYFAVGSGIFYGLSGALAYTHNPDGISKLVVARVARTGHPPVAANASITAITRERSWDWKDDGKDVKMECSRQILNDADDIYDDYRCVEEITTNYTFVKLTDSNGHVEACNNGMCCWLDYAVNKLSEDFYLGVYNGTHNAYDRYFWAEENCVLVRCEASGNNPCSTFPRHSKTRFHLVQLRANFTTRFVYPSVLSNGMRLIPPNEWNYVLSERGPTHEAKISFKSQPGKNLISAGFKARCFGRDQPYIR